MPVTKLYVSTDFHSWHLKTLLHTLPAMPFLISSIEDLGQGKDSSGGWAWWGWEGLRDLDNLLKVSPKAALQKTIIGSESVPRWSFWDCESLSSIEGLGEKSMWECVRWA